MTQDSALPITQVATTAEPIARREALPARDGSEEAALLAVLPHACFVLDSEWRFTYVNVAAEKLFAHLLGQPCESLVGRNIWEACPELADSTFSKQCHEALTEQRAVEVETFYPALGRWFALDACPRGGRLCVFLQDATERTRLERELRTRGAALTKADRGKDLFLLQLAHKVRNALASIRNALHLVRSHHLGTDDQEACALAQEEVQGLSRLMDDLLRVAEVTRAQPNKERINLSAVVARSVQTLLLSPNTGGRSLSVQLPPEPLWLDADPALLEQILGHLLDNAVQFTGPRGSIRLTAERDGEAVTLRVQDNGAGVPLEMQTHIFNLFMRPDDEADRFRGGLGVGLTLVRRLAELHGGTVEVRSEGPNRGTEFVVRLPAPAAPRSDRDANDGEADAPPLRVLVVDDNHDAARSTSLLMQSWGCEVATAYDGLRALEMAKAFHPEVVLLDLKMPRMDGYEVADWLRRDTRGHDFTLVALTGCDSDEDRERASEAGFDYYMVKPVILGDLKELLESLRAKREFTIRPYHEG